MNELAEYIALGLGGGICLRLVVSAFASVAWVIDDVIEAV